MILSSTFIVSVMLFASLNFDLLLGKDVINGKFKLMFIEMEPLPMNPNNRRDLLMVN